MDRHVLIQFLVSLTQIIALVIILEKKIFVERTSISADSIEPPQGQLL